VCRTLCRSACSRAGRLRDAENDKFRRPHDRNPDLGDHLPKIAHFRRIELLIAFHIKRFLRRQPEEGAVAPEDRKEGGDVEDDARPQPRIVRFEHNPLRTALDRLLQESREAADADVLPFEIPVATIGARTPYVYVAIQQSDAIDPLWI